MDGLEDFATLTKKALGPRSQHVQRCGGRPLKSEARGSGDTFDAGIDLRIDCEYFVKVPSIMEAV